MAQICTADRNLNTYMLPLVAQRYTTDKCWWLGFCSDHSADYSGPALLFVGVWMWLTFLWSLHDSHLPAGSQCICICPLNIGCCLLVVQPLQLWSPCLSLISFRYTCPTRMTCRRHCCRFWWRGSVSQCLAHSLHTVRSHPCREGGWLLFHFWTCCGAPCIASSTPVSMYVASSCRLSHSQFWQCTGSSSWSYSI